MLQQNWVKGQVPQMANQGPIRMTPVNFGYPPSSFRESVQQYKCQHEVILVCGSAPKVGQNTRTPKGTSGALK